MVKMTFTLDEVTVEALQRSAQRTGKPQSAIVREAIREYGERADRLSEAERRRMLDALDVLAAAKPTRSAAAVKRELAEIRAARRAGGRRHA